MIVLRYSPAFFPEQPFLALSASAYNDGGAASLPMPYTAFNSSCSLLRVVSPAFTMNSPMPLAGLEYRLARNTSMMNRLQVCGYVYTDTRVHQPSLMKGIASASTVPIPLGSNSTAMNICRCCVSHSLCCVSHSLCCVSHSLCCVSLTHCAVSLTHCAVCLSLTVLCVSHSLNICRWSRCTHEYSIFAPEL